MVEEGYQFPPSLTQESATETSREILLIVQHIVRMRTFARNQGDASDLIAKTGRVLRYLEEVFRIVRPHAMEPLPDWENVE